MPILHKFKFEDTEIERFANKLLHGLPKALNSLMGVEDITVILSEGASLKVIDDWQKEVNFQLPEDLAKFYSMMNGFYLSWGYKMKKHKILKVGQIKVEPLHNLKPTVFENDGLQLELFKTLDLVCTDDSPKFHSECYKIIQLESTRDCALVCLVYSETSKSHTIWLLDRSLQWHFVADSFLKYFNMMVKSGGLPQWHLRFTTIGMSMWAKQFYNTFDLYLRNHTLIKGKIEDSQWSVERAQTRACYRATANEPSTVRLEIAGKAENTKVTAFQTFSSPATVEASEPEKVGAPTEERDSQETQ